MARTKKFGSKSRKYTKTTTGRITKAAAARWNRTIKVSIPEEAAPIPTPMTHVNTSSTNRRQQRSMPTEQQLAASILETEPQPTIRRGNQTSSATYSTQSEPISTPGTSSATPTNTPKLPESATHRKFIAFKDFPVPNEDDSVRNCVFDLSLLGGLVQNTLCNSCQTVGAYIDINQTGFVCKVTAKCVECHEVVGECKSSRIAEDGKFDVNKRMTHAAMEMGTGYAGLEKLSMALGLSMFAQDTFTQHSKDLTTASKLVVNENLDQAAEEIRRTYKKIHSDILEDDIIDIPVSFDGTWQKRGFTSNYGVGAAIELLTGLVIDYEVLSKYCRSCEQKKKTLKEDSYEYAEWYKKHTSKCAKNFPGSSGAMEAMAAEKIWKRSIEKYNFRYTTIISDGDSKTFDHLTSLQVYGPDHELEKEECINHVAKRLGKALRTLAKGEKLGGKKRGALKIVTMVRLQNYFRNAIKLNPRDLSGMRAAVFAAPLHCMSTDEHPHHTRCPKGETSFCFFQRALAKKEKPGKHADNIKTPLSYRVASQVIKIYERLGSIAMLKRCLQGKTQNANESLNAVIWSKCPKTIFVSKQRIDYGVASGVVQFNGGRAQVARIMKEAKIEPGAHSIKIMNRLNKKRKKASCVKNTVKHQQNRQSSTLKKSVQEQQRIEKEGGPSYEGGAF